MTRVWIAYGKCRVEYLAFETASGERIILDSDLPEIPGDVAANAKRYRLDPYLQVDIVEFPDGTVAIALFATPDPEPADKFMQELWELLGKCARLYDVRITADTDWQGEDVKLIEAQYTGRLKVQETLLINAQVRDLFERHQISGWPCLTWRKCRRGSPKR